MTTPTIRLAHSKRKTGVTVYSYAAWPSDRYGIQKDNFNTVSHDTLEEAMTEIHKRIAYDWCTAGWPRGTTPDIIDCGKVADITGRTRSF